MQALGIRVGFAFIHARTRRWMCPSKRFRLFLLLAELADLSSRERDLRPSPLALAAPTGWFVTPKVLFSFSTTPRKP